MLSMLQVPRSVTVTTEDYMYDTTPGGAVLTVDVAVVGITIITVLGKLL